MSSSLPWTVPPQQAMFIALASGIVKAAPAVHKAIAEADPTRYPGIHDAIAYTPTFPAWRA